MAKSFAFNPFTGNFDVISTVAMATFGSSPNSSGASINAGTQILTLQPADGSNPGGVSTGTQTFAGAKTFSSAMTASAGLSANNSLITNVATPVSGSDAATKTYADNIANGLSWKTTVRSATTTTLPAYTYNNGASGFGATITALVVGALPAQDGVTMAPGDRLLVKDETAGNAPYNGIYIVTVLGSVGIAFILTRSTDNDSDAEMISATVEISPEATTQAGYGYRQNSDPVTIGTTAISWVNFTIGVAYTFTNGVQLSGSTVSANVDNSTIEVSSNQLRIKDSGVTNAKLANMANNTVKGNKSGGSAAPTDLALSDVVETTSSVLTITNGSKTIVGSSNLTIQVTLADATHSGYLSSTDWNTFNNKQAAGNYITALTGDVTATGPGSVAATIAANAVTNAKLAQMPAHTFKGNNTGSTANALDLTQTQLTAELNQFTISLQGVVPGSGGGTSNFLRADGTWAAPTGASTVRAINAQTGTTYTFALTDGSGNGNNPYTTFGSSSATTVTVPPNGTVAFPTGSQIDVLQVGTGAVTFAPGSGVTINSYQGELTILGQYKWATLIKTGTNTWDLYGDLLGPIIATGGTITTDGNYKVHTFTSSGTFTITSGAGTVESLVIAGGGGGGTGDVGNDTGGGGGGGGAGGMKYTTPGTTYSVGAYTVTVGAGGAQNVNGSNSVFDSLTATGGGYGSKQNGTVGSGGSGGGGSSNAGNAPGTGTAGQGNNGGSAFPGGLSAAAGGGGGAGSVGANAVSQGTAGNGGTGSANSITGASVTYASGGGGAGGGSTTPPSVGGTASAGGGGNGGSTGVGGTAGTANTGGGGGGGGNQSSAGGAGGSGIVIVRYRFQ